MCFRLLYWIRQKNNAKNRLNDFEFKNPGLVETWKLYKRWDKGLFTIIADHIRVVLSERSFALCAIYDLYLNIYIFFIKALFV